MPATMTKTTKKTRKPATPVHGTAKWIGGTPTQGRLDDGDAIIQITAEGKESSFFHVESVRDGNALRGYRLIKIAPLDETATYDLEITPYGLRCDCPDALYTDRPDGAAGCACKHAKGVLAALKSAKLI